MWIGRWLPTSSHHCNHCHTVWVGVVRFVFALSLVLTAFCSVLFCLKFLRFSFCRNALMFTQKHHLCAYKTFCSGIWNTINKNWCSQNINKMIDQNFDSDHMNFECNSRAMRHTQLKNTNTHTPNIFTPNYRCFSANVKSDWWTDELKQNSNEKAVIYLLCIFKNGQFDEKVPILAGKPTKCLRH